jgi:glycosyltransferase involved in cell wall biosynthesis
MAGPDSGEQDGCLELVKQYGLSDSVEFTGMLLKEEINIYGDKCDIFINTSQMDNIPVTLIEAAAMGLPIVSTNPGGIPMLFEHEKEALLVSPDNTEEMASAIERLVNESELAEKITANAFNKIRDHTWDKIWPKWERVFQKVLSR